MKWLAVCLLAGTAHAGTVAVATPAELVAAIENAQAGDEIVLADGTYPLTGVTCAAVGTAAAPIVVRAANLRGAKIELDALEGFKVTGAHWQFDGLDIVGTCAVDSDCEHAFHVTGAAHGFTLTRSRVVDFNAQLKVNAEKLGDVYVAPDDGRIEGNEIGDTRGRDTANPVTKLNIDTGARWIVRGNYLHDAYKIGGNGISYAAFMKSGGTEGVFERNLVVCSRETTGGTRIGLSFGGGGTAPQFCAPAYDANVPCAVEHRGGTIRNNIIASCSDVGIYLNRAADTRVLYNTLIATTGIDFRFDTTSGVAIGNLMTDTIHLRDGGMATQEGNRTDVDPAMFAALYRAPLVGDLAVVGDVTPLQGAGPHRGDVANDYCAQTRPTGSYTLGAIEHTVGTCDTTFPPAGGGGEPGGDDAGPGHQPPEVEDGGCCGADGRGSAIAGGLVVAFAWRRRRRR